ncbi:hypothetical protein E5843_14255 [Luteimonas yindakuii]|uniref:hypothetical protein n=1 Tax=Luteimonas yindakuii TaxID=2565782 RepID=UPI0010A41981|nr:hypothetical protein [Luteimonas yindakuii]QCO68647.1 hypothetical protein E5843_14255 [Luteimonas yindakuii]
MSGVSGLLTAALLWLLTAPAAFAFFAAYWAQQTRRNPWLWFFFGLLLMPLAGVVLLMLNKDRPAAPTGVDHGHLLSIRNDLP